MISLVRIDHRLLHGQVVFAWVKHFDISRIIVVDDMTARDEIGKISLNLAKPVDVKLNIYTVDEILALMPKVEKLKDNVMLVFKTVENTRRFCEGYSSIGEINYGGIANKEGSKQYSNAVFLNESELEDTRKIRALGVKLYMQQVPSSVQEDITDKI